jgi:hypothetical protein
MSLRNENSPRNQKRATAQKAAIRIASQLRDCMSADSLGSKRSRALQDCRAGRGGLAMVKDHEKKASRPDHGWRSSLPIHSKSARTSRI